MREVFGIGKFRQSGHRLALIAALLAAGSIAACAGNDKAQDTTAQNNDAISDGKVVAQNECSGCHAIGTQGDSPRADAPVFRRILSRYRGDVLEDELVEGIKLGHPDMPQFKLNPRAVDDLVAYLRSIQETATLPASN